MKKIIHISTGLENGGAEGVLYRLCKGDKHNTHIVVSLIGRGKYADLLEAEGIRVYCLNMPSGRVSINGLLTLYRLIKQQNADVIQTWMYHADLIGGVVAKLARAKSIYWNVRHSTIEIEHSKKSLVLVAKACSILSKWIPKKIIYCAEQAKVTHEQLGYDSSKSIVIGNGYDLELFTVDNAGAHTFRSSIGLEQSELLIGMIGRYNPQKDHHNLLQSLNLVKRAGYSFKCVLIGREIERNNQVLFEQVDNLNLTEEIILLGQRTDIPHIMNALDINILSSSFGEGFPNVLAEAMACGTPCVTTNVGDAGLIVKSTGWVVSPKNHNELADAIIGAIKEKELQEENWLNRSKACRKRVEDNFSINSMINNYHAAWSI